MEPRAKFLGHSIHQMLIPFPLGVLGIAVVFDVIALVTARHTGLFLAAHYMIAAGVISGLLAAVFGAIDFFAIPHATRAKRVGTLHGSGNVVVVLLFAASWYLRREVPTDPSMLALILSFAGFAVSGLTAWLGGELVSQLGVGVHDDAHLDAPSSLRRRVAR